VYFLMIKIINVPSTKSDQHRTFPFWDYLKDNTEEAFKECPGVKKSIDFQIIHFTALSVVDV
jgi:hypothetical protein